MISKKFRCVSRELVKFELRDFEDLGDIRDGARRRFEVLVLEYSDVLAHDEGQHCAPVVHLDVADFLQNIELESIGLASELKIINYYRNVKSAYRVRLPPFR